jgi:hypothetical protein
MPGNAAESRPIDGTVRVAVLPRGHASAWQWPEYKAVLGDDPPATLAGIAEGLLESSGYFAGVERSDADYRLHLVFKTKSVTQVSSLYVPGEPFLEERGLSGIANIVFRWKHGGKTVHVGGVPVTARGLRIAGTEPTREEFLQVWRDILWEAVNAAMSSGYDAGIFEHVAPQGSVPP